MPGSGERIGAFEAKTQLPRLLRRVQAAERFIITRHGRPVVELVPYVGPAPERVTETIGRLRSLRERLGRRGVRFEDVVGGGGQPREALHRGHRY